MKNLLQHINQLFFLLGLLYISSSYAEIKKPIPPDNASIKTTSEKTWWKPKPGKSWQINYSAKKDKSINVDIYNIDLFDTSKKDINALHAKGKRVICYFSGGSFEEWRPDAKDFPASVKGKNLEGWPKEKWLDIKNLTTLLPIMEKRMKLAASKGCDAVDPDNMNVQIQKSGFKISPKDQLTYNIRIARKAHRLGLAIGLKNDLVQIKGLVNHFDFAVNEECFAFDECELLLPFIKQGKPVFSIEYNLKTSKFCKKANKMNFDSLKKNLSLDAYRSACR
ncbi:MAG: endo alpha-1,4 polygalactosaminidase [Methylococcales bacterium]|nr:endo alpha-1,4 polygalactosaminidase [Methylococcales bacterium]